MANQFASFNQSSAISSISHDPVITLASNCIRDYFGPTVQLVADCIQIRGGESTLSQIINTINTKLNSKVRSSEREKMINISEYCMPNALGTPTTSSIRASLLVLIQHSIVTYSKTTTTAKSSSRPKTVYRYKFDPDRARILIRYSRFVEYTKKSLGDIPATLIEELLLHGRMRTVDAVESTVEQLKQQKNPPTSDRYTYREAVLGSFRRLVSGGFVKEVKEVRYDDDEDEEMEFQDHPASTTSREESDSTDDPATISLLQNGQYRSLPPAAIWSVNIGMFHDSLRAVSLGTLVSEMYGQKVKYSGSLVAAALKLAAYKEHAEGDADFESQILFTTEDIRRYLPKAVLQDLEKKPGGLTPNLYKALVELAKFSNPQVVQEIEVADGHTEDAKFQITTQKLVQYMQERVTNQVRTVFRSKKGVYDSQLGDLKFFCNKIV